MSDALKRERREARRRRRAERRAARHERWSRRWAGVKRAAKAVKESPFCNWLLRLGVKKVVDRVEKKLDD